MQDMFSKDLKEIKNNWPVINNAITEIKNTLEETNSTVTETEERINVLEDKMVEINEAEWKKEKKEYEEVRSASETFETMLNAPTFKSYVSQKKKTKRKSMIKYLRR